MRITNTEDYLKGYGIKCLINGQSGVGKTRSVISLKDAGFKPIIVSAESGILSLQGNNIPMIDISKDDSGKDLEMKDRIKRLAEVFTWLKEGQKEYDTVFLDSLTEINQTLMAHLEDKHKEAKDTLKKYGDNMTIMMKLVREFRDLPYNVVIVSLSEIEKDDIGRRYTTSSVVGKVAQHLPSFFDEVFNLSIHEDDKKTPVPKFQCRASADIVCKDRSGKLQMFEPYNLGEIFKKIKKETTK
jgi:adenosyl cobinamide kinase/adenosyl cobinamide phosphate guanylyltransferase